MKAGSCALGGLNRWSKGPRGPGRAGAGVSGRHSRPYRTAEISRAGDEGVGRDVPGSGVPGRDVTGGEAHRAHAGTGAVAGAVTDGALTDSHGLHAVIVTA